MDASSDVPERRWIIGYVSALTGITFVFCLIRLISRHSRGTLSFGFDDLFIALSWLTSTAMTSMTIVGDVRYHFGRPTDNIKPDLLPTAMQVRSVGPLDVANPLD